MSLIGSKLAGDEGAVDAAEGCPDETELEEVEVVPDELK
jgi:hypothetical protein